MMSTLRFAFLSLSIVFAAAGCGGDDGLVTGDGGTADLSSNKDASASTDQASSAVYDLSGVDLAGISCGAQTCGANMECCLTPDIQAQTVSGQCVPAGTSCGDGGVPLACDGPEDCPMATAQCCVDLALGSGNMSVSGSAACTSSCPASVVTTNGGTLKTRLCHSPADCTNYSGTAPVVGTAPFDKCCSYPGLSFEFCAPGLVTLASNKIKCM